MNLGKFELLEKSIKELLARLDSLNAINKNLSQDLIDMNNELLEARQAKIEAESTVRRLESERDTIASKVDSILERLTADNAN